jgi:tRNA G37 N-methylase Trm5
MQFTFMYPVKMTAADGLMFIAAEIEMKAEIEVDALDPESYRILALYASTLALQSDWIEINPRSYDYTMAVAFLRTDRETRERMDQMIQEEVAENYPKRRSVVSEHRTYYGRL